MKGLIIWRLQRYSALIMFAYLAYVFSFFVRSQEVSFFIWSDFFLSLQMRSLTSIIFILLLFHVFIGLWTVGTDYLTKRTLGLLNQSLVKYADLIRNFYFLCFGLIGFIYLTSILYIIWL